MILEIFAKFDLDKDEVLNLEDAERAAGAAVIFRRRKWVPLPANQLCLYQ